MMFSSKSKRLQYNPNAKIELEYRGIVYYLGQGNPFVPVDLGKLKVFIVFSFDKSFKTIILKLIAVKLSSSTSKNVSSC